MMTETVAMVVGNEGCGGGEGGGDRVVVVIVMVVREEGRSDTLGTKVEVVAIVVLEELVF